MCNLFRATALSLAFSLAATALAQAQTETQPTATETKPAEAALTLPQIKEILANATDDSQKSQAMTDLESLATQGNVQAQNLIVSTLLSARTTPSITA